MSKYTMSLHTVIDYYTRETVEGWFKDYELNEYLTNKQIEVISNAGIWNKDKLAKKIVDHYFMREIAYETPKLFSHYVKVKMQEIMERYLPLIYSASIDFDPMINVDFTEELNRGVKQVNDTTNTTSSNSTNNASGIVINSDTPQGQINKANILNGTYATSTSANETTGTITDTSNATGNSNLNTDESYIKKVKGNNGVMTTNQKLIEQYRAIVVGYDTQIIEELNNLFFGLW